MQVFVLGAGLAGLSTAHALARAGQRVTVLEKEGHVGGMAHSFRVGPYWLDLGPHRFHTTNQGVLDQVDQWLDGDLLSRQRLSRIHLLGRFFDYPLRAQNVLRGLPPSLLTKALIDWAIARTRRRLAPRPEADFESWVVARFGRTLYEVFFGAYTAKAWGMPCDQISADWARQRIGHRGLWDVINKALRPPSDGVPRSLVTEFRYPRSGGIGAISRSATAAIESAGGRVLKNAPVTRLELDGRRISRIRSGGNRVFVLEPDDVVVNTLPLPSITRALRPLPPTELLAAAGHLRHVAIVFIYLEVRCPSVSPDHWIYLPEPHLRVHRVSEFKNFSDASAPGPTTALCCEITCRVGDGTWRMGLEEAARLAEADLVRTGLVEPGSCRGLALRRLPHAYPIYDLEYRAHLNRVRDGLRAVTNLHTTGRQGLFRYNNMDHSIAMGRHVARGIIQGAGKAGETDSHAVAAEEVFFG